MLFNSIAFAIFLPIVFLLYWLLAKKSLGWQNTLLLIAGYFFYAFWDWRFLFLLLFSTLLDFYSGLKISEAKNNGHKTFWFYLSICINLGVLGLFKYYNFFAESFTQALSHFGMQVNAHTLKIILPIGISFYTFHGLSYIIDVYKNKIKPEKNIINYSLFVSFFPLLVAGPIERATHLLPQLKQKRSFSYAQATEGLRQILWGLFKKVVIADNCAEFANDIFNNSAQYNGSTLALGALMFTFQIYGDFSGYSDMAIGTAKLFGIDLLKNFAYPYFSRSVAEFWRRWHISLSSWFKDYLYIPLGGSKVNTWLKIRNTFIVFIISGFWHGANWTFIFWGLLNALYIMPSIIFNNNRNNLEIVAKGKYLPTIKELIAICLTFSLTVFAWIFFRSEDLNAAFNYIFKMFGTGLFTAPKIMPKKIFFVIIVGFIVVEWFGREQVFALANLNNKFNAWVRWLLYLLIVFVIFVCHGREQIFIYFQF
jgi:D-alanyl-lipoteichoic acid acyltransferase DltB (MBOAT superfamily)